MERSIEDYCEIILKVTGASSSLVSYKEVEENTTLVKTIDFSKAISDLKHDPKISPEEGIERTVDWMKFYYRK